MSTPGPHKVDPADGRSAIRKGAQCVVLPCPPTSWLRETLDWQHLVAKGTNYLSDVQRPRVKPSCL